MVNNEEPCPRTNKKRSVPRLTNYGSLRTYNHLLRRPENLEAEEFKKKRNQKRRPSGLFFNNRCQFYLRREKVQKMTMKLFFVEKIGKGYICKQDLMLLNGVAVCGEEKLRLV